MAPNRRCAVVSGTAQNDFTPFSRKMDINFRKPVFLRQVVDGQRLLMSPDPSAGGFLHRRFQARADGAGHRSHQRRITSRGAGLGSVRLLIQSNGTIEGRRWAKSWNNSPRSRCEAMDSRDFENAGVIGHDRERGPDMENVGPTASDLLPPPLEETRCPLPRTHVA